MPNTKKYSMDYNEANNTLQNIFDACNVSHNTIPFDKIMLRSMAEPRLVNHVCKLAIFILLLVILCPLTFKRDSSFAVLNNSINQPVVVTDHQLFSDSFSMKIYGSGIQYDKINASRDNGSIIFPSSIDTANGLIVFPYDGKSLSISIPCENGYELKAVLYERK